MEPAVEAAWLIIRSGEGRVDMSLLPPGPRRYDEATPLAARPAGP